MFHYINAHIGTSVSTDTTISTIESGDFDHAGIILYCGMRTEFPPDRQSPAVDIMM
jgi:hypothetical protein